MTDREKQREEFIAMRTGMFLSCDKLKEHIIGTYDRLKDITQRDGVFQELDVWFDNSFPPALEGDVCYSDIYGYHYGGYERGNKTEKVTEDLFDVTYRVIEGRVWQMASAYECKHRIPGQDSRLLMFQKELEYMGAIGEEFQRKRETKVSRLLRTPTSPVSCDLPPEP